MPQFARPDSAPVATWHDQNGNFAALPDTVNEIVPDDSTYVESDDAPSQQAVVFHLSALRNPDLFDPQYGDPYIVGAVLLRWGKNLPGGAQIDIGVTLWQDFVDMARPGYHVLETVIPDVPDGFVIHNIEFFNADITDYANLSLRFVAQQVGPGDDRRARVSFVALRLADVHEGAGSNQWDEGREW